MSDSHTTQQSSAFSPALSLALIVIGLIFAAANMRSPLVMIGSIAPMLDRDFGLSADQIGYLGALPMPLFALGSLVAAVLARRFGLERMMILMTLLLACGVAMRSWFGVAALFFGTLILSFAIGMLNALTAPFIKQYAPNNISLATGVFSLSMSLLAGIGAWSVVPLADHVGWQMAVSAWAVFGVVAALIWWRIYQAHKGTAKTAKMAHNAAMMNPWRKKAAWQMAVLLGLQSLLFYAIHRHGIWGKFTRSDTSGIGFSADGTACDSDIDLADATRCIGQSVGADRLCDECHGCAWDAVAACRDGAVVGADGLWLCADIYT